MRETPGDLEQLQELLDASTSSGPASSCAAPSRCPSVPCRQPNWRGVLDGHPTTVALATTTAKGEPRVAPTDALFYRGFFHVPTVAASARARHVLKRPAVSLTYYEGNDLAVIVHGRAVALGADDPSFAKLDVLQREHGESPSEWGEGIFLRVEADVLYTYTSDPRRYPG